MKRILLCLFFAVCSNAFAMEKAKQAISAEKGNVKEEQRIANSFFDALMKPSLQLEEEDNQFVYVFNSYKNPETKYKLKSDEAKLIYYKMIRDFRMQEQVIAEGIEANRKKLLDDPLAKLTEQEIGAFQKMRVIMFIFNFDVDCKIKDEKKSIKKQHAELSRLNHPHDEYTNKRDLLLKEGKLATQRIQQYDQIRFNRNAFITAFLIGDKELINEAKQKELQIDEKSFVPLTSYIRILRKSSENPCVQS